MPTIDELKILQALPLDIKIYKTQQRIREWVDYYGVDGVCVSFSGGKDSTVLLHLVRELYPNVEAVFVNTGLEYPEIQQFAKSFDNVTVLRPKMRFDEVIRTYGYPIIGKEVALCIEYARKGKQWALYNLDGKDNNGEPYEFRRNMYGKYKPLVDVDFNISSKCCGIMKEKPLGSVKKKHFVAILAQESQRREKAWLKTGCNAFDAGMSKPMSFWTEQDILTYIKAYNVPIASVYGDVVETGDDGNQLCLDSCGKRLKCTGCQRTGCIFCGFGAHRDQGESRFERLKRTHPRQYDYCMNGGGYDFDGLWKPTAQGLGMKHVFDTVNDIYGKNFIRY